MPICSKCFRLIPVVLVLATVASCRYGPAPVRQPGINASQAGKQAIEMYDTDGDGKVAGAELDKAPSLKAALPRLDTNGDGAVSADEVAARVNVWKSMGSALTGIPGKVTLDGQPLAGATVTLEPEPFLGDEIKAAVGVSNNAGLVAPSIPKEQRPDPSLPGGANFGLYKVRISKVVNGKETIPERYNTQTILGQEISDDDPGVRSMNIQYVLKSGG